MFATETEQKNLLDTIKKLPTITGVIDTEKFKNKKVAIMYSGGMDSTVVMAELIAKGADVYPMSYDDASLAGLFKKSPAVEKLMQHYRIYNKLIKIRMYEVEKMRGSDLFGFIPGWKMVMQVSAMAHCQAHEIDYLFFGYNGGNYAGAYLDELPEFIEDTTKLYNRMYGSKIETYYPYFDYTKADMVTVGNFYNVPFQYTISCRQIQFPGLFHCGECEVCMRRKESFNISGIKDPTVYVSDIRNKTMDFNSLSI